MNISKYSLNSLIHLCVRVFYKHLVLVFDVFLFNLLIFKEFLETLMGCSVALRQ